MNIIINTPESLNDFATKMAKKFKVSPSRFKTAIAKAYGYKHITAFEEALIAREDSIHLGRQEVTDAIINSTNSVAKELDYFKENIDRIIAKDKLEAREIYRIVDADYYTEDIPETLIEIAKDPDLAMAVGILKVFGIESIAENLMVAARTGILVEELHEMY